jgi:hypothetical protein
MFKTFQESKERPRINEAVLIIGNRIQSGEKTTAIVVPPRYGKSDIIRLAAIEYQEIGLIETSIVLSPWTQTRAQLVEQSKIDEMQTRYGIQKQIWMTELESEQVTPRFWEQKPRRQLFSLTIGAAIQASTLIILKDAAAYLAAKGKRLLAFIDECHSVAGSDGWGAVALALENCGAHLVLLTGTAERSDNLAPYGFRVIEIDRKSNVEFNVYKGLTDDGLRRKYDRYTADRITSRLNADLEVPLTEAWNMGILAHVQVRWFTCDVNDAPLSEITDDATRRRALPRLTRHDEVLEEGIQIFVEDIHARRQSRPNSAGIIFVGNDRLEDETDNHHAKLVRAKVVKIWREQFGAEPIVQIATLDNRNDNRTAAAILRRFREEGLGDILILKQMGGVGYDVARLKTILDLSTVRTKSATTQRWLRAATQWAKVMHCTLVLPNDIGTVSLYQEIVQEQGGEFSELTSRVFLRQFEVEVTEGDDLEISNVDEAGVSDCDGRFIDVDENRLVDDVLMRFPSIVDRFTRTEISVLLKEGAFPTTGPTSTSPVSAKSVDIDFECSKLRGQINTRVRDLAQNEAPYVPVDENKAKAHVERKRYWMTQAKEHGGFRMELNRCIDLERLQKAADFLKRACEEQGIPVSG